jgi:hypothetical protein
MKTATLRFALVLFTSAFAATAIAESSDRIPEGSDQVSLMERPTTGWVWEPVAARKPNAAPALVSKTLFLNNCKPNGCQLRSGQTDSRYDYSSIPRNGNPKLAAFGASDATWNQVVQCMKETFAPFSIDITTVDPGTAPHMEIMIAGLPTNLGLSNGIGGIAPYQCGYIENSLSFAFANVYQGNALEICSTAAQEVAHTWSLDHVIEPSDPMTYYPYNGHRFFKDSPIKCGSDCQGGIGPLPDRNGGQVTCTGPTQQEHACTCGGATQNSVAIIKNIFGGAMAKPPIVKFTAPREGDKIQIGAPVHVDIKSEYSLKKAEMRVDGVVTATLNSQPFAFNLPNDAVNGKHVLEVTVYDIFGAIGKASVNVELAGPCGSYSDCNSTQTCVGGRCVVGPGTVGGIGEVCTGNGDCASGVCGSDGGAAKYCVEACNLGSSDCPTGFGCLDAGGKGVCWPNGESKDPGGCSAGSNGALLPMAFSLFLGVAVFGRRSDSGRRRRNA